MRHGEEGSAGPPGLPPAAVRVGGRPAPWRNLARTQPAASTDGRIHFGTDASTCSRGLDLLFPFDLLTAEGIVLQQEIKSALDGARSGSVSLGLHARQQPPASSKRTVCNLEVLGHRHLHQKLNAVVLGLVLRSGRPFTWTSLQLHRNVRCSRHVDSGVGVSLLVVTGSFKGGTLEIDGVPGINLHNQAIFFDPSVPHQVLDHSGDRFSLVAYMHPASASLVEIPDDMAMQLKNSGFRSGFNHLPSYVPPVRVQLTAGIVNAPGVVYIGRRHAGFGLPRTVWANPYVISKSRDRRRVMKLFRYHLSKSKYLAELLESLGGKRLACHCPPHLDCHGDLLVEAYTDRFLPRRSTAPTGAALDDARQTRLGCPRQPQHRLQRLARTPPSPP